MNTTLKIIIGATSMAVLFLATPVGLAEDSGSVAAIEAQQSTDVEKIGKTVEKIVKASQKHFEHGGAEATIVPVMGIFGVFIAPMLVVIGILWLAYRSKDKERQQKHETIRLMLEKGVEIPPDFSFGEPASSPKSAMRRGTILISVGIGIMCFFISIGESAGIGIGCIPLLIGLAYLLIWYIEKNQAQDK